MIQNKVSNEKVYKFISMLPEGWKITMWLQGNSTIKRYLYRIFVIFTLLLWSIPFSWLSNSVIFNVYQVVFIAFMSFLFVLLMCDMDRGMFSLVIKCFNFWFNYVMIVVFMVIYSLMPGSYPSYVIGNWSFIILRTLVIFWYAILFGMAFLIDAFPFLGFKNKMLAIGGCCAVIIYNRFFILLVHI